MNLQEFQNTVDDLIALYKRWELLKWENARLREALERISKASMSHEEPVSRAIASAALKEE